MRAALLSHLVRVIVVIAAILLCAVVVYVAVGVIIDWLTLGSTLALSSDKKEADLGPAFTHLFYGFLLACIVSIWFGFAVWKWTGGRQGDDE